MEEGRMFSLTNKTKSSSPISELFFNKIKEEILGKRYELSLVYIGDYKAKKLNMKYRNKTYIPNVLSFPVDQNIGEIYINLNQLRKETKKFNMNYKTLTKYMFIHGCLHLKGLEHGEKMEKLEQKYLKKL
jgi:probable rRNA maturation factor